MLYTTLLLSVSHGGEYHPPGTDCPGSLFAGATDNNNIMFTVEWLAQKVYASQGGSIIHRWDLPDASATPLSTVNVYSIAPADNGAFVLAGTNYSEITLDTVDIEWVPLSCSVQKVRRVNGQYYGLNFGTAEIFRIPECELVTTGPATLSVDVDFVRAWSFAISPTSVFTVGMVGQSARIFEQNTDNNESWTPLEIDLYKGVSRPPGIAHAYGDIFWDEPRSRLLAVQGETCFECEAAQEKATYAGKVVQILPTVKVLAVGLRHPYHNQIVGDKLLIGDVGGGIYEELNVLDLANDDVRNFMWPLYEAERVFKVTSPFYGGEMTPPTLQVQHCVAENEWGSGVVPSIVGGAFSLLAICHALYKRDWANALIRAVIGIGLSAPVWYYAFHGPAYYEGIIYSVQGGEAMAFEKKADKWVEWGLMLASLLLSYGGGFIAAIDAISILSRERHGPFKINVGFVAVFYVITLGGTLYQFRDKLRGLFNRARQDDNIS